MYTTCISVTRNPTGNVIISADIIAKRLSSVYKAEGKILAATNSRTIRQVETAVILWHGARTDSDSEQKSSSDGMINASVSVETTWKCSGIAVQ